MIKFLKGWIAQWSKPINSVLGLVLRCIWLIISLLIVGFGWTNEWFVWGFMCSLPIIGDVFRKAIAAWRSGWRSGANTYTATVTSYGVTVSNHPFRDAIIDFFLSLVISVLLGPIFLTFRIIIAIIDVVKYVIVLIKNKKEKTPNMGEIQADKE